METYLSLDTDIVECFICKDRRIEVGPPCGHFVCTQCMDELIAIQDSKRRATAADRPGDTPDMPAPSPDPDALAYTCGYCRGAFSSSSVKRLPCNIRDALETSAVETRCKCGWKGPADEAAAHECFVTADAARARERAVEERVRAEQEQQQAAEAAAAARRIAEAEAERDAAAQRAAAEAAARQQLEADAADRERDRLAERAAEAAAAARRVAEVEAEREAAERRAAAEAAATAQAAMERDALAQRVAAAEAERDAEAARRESAARDAAAKTKRHVVLPRAPTFTAMPEGPPPPPAGYMPPAESTAALVRQHAGAAMGACVEYAAYFRERTLAAVAKVTGAAAAN
jgi:chemotaxis protein histidine kinase CheA